MMEFKRLTVKLKNCYRFVDKRAMSLNIIGFIFILLCFAFSLRAEELHPHAPRGWVEMNSLEPVILTWAKGDPTKKLEQVPSIMVQKFPRDKKFVDFVNEKPLDEKGCRSLEAGGWNQTWCLRNKSVMAILSRDDVKEVEGLVKKWALSHD